MKRLYICQYKGANWISGIVANSDKEAKKIFYHEYKHTVDSYYAWLDIRVKIRLPYIEIPDDFPIGEIDADWGYKNGIYSEMN